jgi:hypothetical protein
MYPWNREGGAVFRRIDDPLKTQQKYFPALSIPEIARPLKNVQLVIANEVRQSHIHLTLKEIASAHMRLAMTGSEFFKGLIAIPQ